MFDLCRNYRVWTHWFQESKILLGFWQWKLKFINNHSFTKRTGSVNHSSILLFHSKSNEQKYYLVVTKSNKATTGGCSIGLTKMKSKTCGKIGVSEHEVDLWNIAVLLGCDCPGLFAWSRCWVFRVSAVEKILYLKLQATYGLVSCIMPVKLYSWVVICEEAFCLLQLRKYFSPKALITVYHSIIYSHYFAICNFSLGEKPTKRVYANCK